MRERLGRSAFEHAAGEHGVERVAGLYAAALEEAAGGSAVTDEVTRRVAESLRDVGLDAEDPEVARVGSRLAEMGL